MKKKFSCSDDSAMLRQKAEEQLQKKLSEPNILHTETDMLKLIHELNVHQIELQMQNEELLMAEAANKRSQLLLVSSLECQKDTILLSVDQNYRYLYFNKAHWESMKYAYGRDVKLGMNILECITSNDDRQTAKENYDRALMGESHSNVRKYGAVEFAWYESFFNPIINDINEIIGATGLARNITERRRIDEALKESERQYRDMFYKNTAVKLIVDPANGAILKANNAASIFYGYSVNCLEKINISQINTLQTEELAAEMALALCERRKYFDFRHRLASGEVRDVEVYSGPIEYGGSPRLYSIVHDVTDRKLAQAALRDMNWRLESIVEGAHVGTWEWNIQTGETVFNQVWAQIIGYSLAELAPVSIKTWKTFTHPDDLKYSEELLKQHFAGDLPYYDFECRMKHKSGHWVWVRDHGRVVSRTDDGKPLMMFGTHTDITDRKLAEEKLELEHLQLLKLDAEKDKFFSVIAHDLRSPFNGFLGLTEIMVEGLSGMTMEQIQQMAVLLRKSATNLYSLLGNLLEWSRMQRGLTAFAPSSFLLMPKISESMVLIKDAADKKNILICYAVPEDLTIFADGNMLGGILRNLVTNAVKFTPKGGIITISARPNNDNMAEMSVKDTGIGMNKDLIDNLFQLDINTNRKGTEGEYSTGLGLMICKDFIEKNGGKLFIESEEGKGSDFKFTMPMKLQELV